MYICICNKVTDQQISEAIESGAHSLKALQKALNLGTNCGSCLPKANSALHINLKKLASENPDLFYAA